VSSVMLRAMELYEQGHIKPITPMKTFSAVQISEPFRYMQKAQHIGKIVVSMPVKEDDLPLEHVRGQLKLRPDRAYLFVGGLGGLGRSIATWLAEKGARHIIFMSRSAGKISDDDPFVKELATVGCTATMVSGDVCNYDDVVCAIKSAGKPVAGVLQASMVLKVSSNLPLSMLKMTYIAQDNALVDMTWDHWQTAVQPKVSGTWNLHHALEREQSEPVDHFFLFSSAGAMSGQWGQANYNAGNTFLDAFVSYRHSLGLAASTVNIGVIEDIGYVSENQDILDSLRSTAQYLMSEPELLDSIELMLQRSTPLPSTSTSTSTLYRYVQHSQIGIGLRSMLPITSPNNRTIWRKDPRMLVYRNLETTSTTPSSSSEDHELNQFLKETASNMTLLKSPESAELLAREIGKTLFGFIMRSDDEALDLDTPLLNVGIDSLVSIEVRNWMRRKLGTEFTVLEIVRADSVRHLGILAQGKLVAKYEARV
jgi:NAD(P)-dependent dehydrogenase (short-subunit alcohol dehydrogenase family)